VSQNGRCFRLDEARPAGRITDRLLSELRTATFCVADLTGNKPNVMWELGFAMALGKPTIVVAQTLDDLPFDLKDMQSIEYQRHHLNSSLGIPLQRMVVDTLVSLNVNQVEAKERNPGNEQVVGTLLTEIAQLKEIVTEAVHAWKDNESTVVKSTDVREKVASSQGMFGLLGRASPTNASVAEREGMCGHWLNIEGQTHIYIRIVGEELVAPYCYGRNDELSSVYFGWWRTGDYWFARYQWLKDPHSGFAFLKRDSIDELNGAWWSAEDENKGGDVPPTFAGVPAKWRRQKGGKTPVWAEVFFEAVTREGIANYLTNVRSSRIKR
jgi:hypothetical protein